VNHALGDTLVVEMKNLLAKMEVLKGSRPARTDSQRVLVVGDRYPLLGRQDRDFAGRYLMCLATFAIFGPHHAPHAPNNRRVGQLNRFALLGSLSTAGRTFCHVGVLV
jgi:hypothetical protein